MDKRESSRIIVTLGVLIAIGPFSVDAYLPGFPAIAEDLMTDIEHVALSLTSYFIGISIGQLFYGPILDRYGRKKPLLIGLAIYVLACAGCVFAPSVQSLILLRFLSAIGACAGIVASRAVVRDLFSSNEMAKVFSLMLLVMGLAPMIAPVLGGIIVSTVGWRGIFVMLVIIGSIISLIVIKFLPETKKADHTVSFHPLKITAGYFSLFRNKTFLIFAIASGTASAALFAYVSASPFVFIKLFGITESQFGWIYGFNALVLISASQFNRMWLEKKTSRQITFITVSLQFLVSLLLILSLALDMYFIVSMAFICIYLFWLGYLNPNTNALAMEPFLKNAGVASAMLGSVQMIFGAAASAMVSFFHNGTAFPMAFLLMAFSLVGLAALTSDRMQTKAQDQARPI